MSRGRSFDDLYVLRLIATVAVIAIHTTSQDMTLSLLGYYGNQLARFSVPMFLILSGFLLFQSDLHDGFLPRVEEFFYRILSGPSSTAWSCIIISTACRIPT